MPVELTGIAFPHSLAQPLSTPIQAVDSSVVVNTTGPVRAAASLLLTVLFGGVVMLFDEPRVDRAIDASRADPFVSVVYGLMAFGLVTFFTAYGLSQLSRLGVGADVVFLFGGAVLGATALAFGGLGFAVVGARLIQFFGAGDRWHGLVGVGAASAVAWLFLPLGLAFLVWLGIAAAGIGGATRQWVHSSTATVDSTD